MPKNAIDDLLRNHTHDWQALGGAEWCPDCGTARWPHDDDDEQAEPAKQGDPHLS